MNKQKAMYEIESANKQGRYANLRSADLSSANLSSANLSSAYLRSANLSSADLRYANLSSANLRYANLSSANLSSADLSSANLRYADLSSAYLSSADLPAPTMVLLANWGNLSDELTIELMRYDAYNHADPYSFDEWKATDRCPFGNTKYQRAANFIEQRGLWPGWNPRKKVKSAFELMTLVIREKCKDSDYHKVVKA